MSIDKKTPYGGIDISLEAIASVAGGAASECYGVIGLVPRGSITDAAKEVLRMEEYVKGIYTRKVKKGYEVDIYLCCAYGVKLSEVLAEVQKRVQYELEKAFGIRFKAVNVFVVDIREVN
ncbi:MAG: Asp23/Gls24 family envelope stress response protein [Bacilli bacterium]|nr:Asp23/Gls24 family envelope stress response protein [Bacilli bacterium]